MKVLPALLREARRLFCNQDGVAAAETVLIAPVAVFVLCLSIEGGHFLYSEHQVLKGVRDAARYASRLPVSTWGCGTSASAETDLPTSNAQWQNIANVAVYGNVAGGSRPRLWSWSATPAGGELVIRYSCSNTGGGKSGIYSESGIAPQIAVIAKPNYPSLLKTMGGFGTNLTLYAREQAVSIGI